MIQRFPFDWKNPIGYLIAIAIEYVMAWYLLVIGAVLIPLAIGSYLYLMALSKCVKGALFAVSQCTNGTKTNQEILERIIEYAELYSRVKQLSLTFFKCLKGRDFPQFSFSSSIVF